jgi:hypothetical protein
MVLAFGVLVGTISAQEIDSGAPYGGNGGPYGAPVPPEGGFPVTGQWYVVNLTASNHPGSYAGAELAGGPRQPVRDCLRHLNVCCWSHHDCVGCSNAKAECAFIFGSCRKFFSEPCWKGPPALPTPYNESYGRNNGEDYGTFGSPGFGRCESCR